MQRLANGEFRLLGDTALWIICQKLDSKQGGELGHRCEDFYKPSERSITRHLEGIAHLQHFRFLPGRAHNLQTYGQPIYLSARNSQGR